VRELVNVIERACSISDTDSISLADLPEHISGLNPLGLSETPPLQGIAPASAREPATPAPRRSELHDMPFKDAKEEWISAFERDYITELLVRHGGNISQASREADIDRKYFRKLMTKYDIEADDV
jgi:DNA-binding NtrC family response regulator